jgi:hypothetical protein
VPIWLGYEEGTTGVDVCCEEDEGGAFGSGDDGLDRVFKELLGAEPVWYIVVNLVPQFIQKLD